MSPFKTTPLAVLTLLVVGPAQARVAFVGLEGLGVDSTMVQPVEQLLQRSLGEVSGGDLIAPMQVTAHLVEHGLGHLAACGGALDCLTDLGGVLDCESVVYGTLTQLGDNYALLLRLIEVSSGTEKSRVQVLLTGSGDELVAAVREVSVKLLNPDGMRGRVVVDDLLVGGSVLIDGVAAVAGADGSFPVPVGRHAVVIAADGHRIWSGWVEVGLDEVAHVDGRLEAISMEGAHAEREAAVEVARLTLAAGVGGLLSARGAHLPGVALELGTMLDSWHLHLRLGAGYRSQTGSARNDASLEVSQSWTMTSGSIGASYRRGLGPLAVRAGLEAGAQLWLADNRVRSAGEKYLPRQQEQIVAPLVVLPLELAWAFYSWEFGLEAAGRYTPGIAGAQTTWAATVAFIARYAVLGG